MGATRRFLPAFTMINAAGMNGNITGTPTNIQYEDSALFHFIYTGTPTGTISVEGSLDYDSRLDSGNWHTIPWSAFAFADVAQPAGAGSDFIAELRTSFPWIRVKYVATGGTGSLTVKVVAKGS